MRKQRGLSYVEVTLAALLLSVGLVPVLQSLQGAGVTAEVHGLLNEEQLALQSRLDLVRNQPFSSLLAMAAQAGSADVAVAAWSDAATARTPVLVFLSAYDAVNEDGDADPFTVTDPNTDGDGSVYTATLPADMLRLMWVKVQISGSDQSLTTLVRR